MNITPLSWEHIDDICELEQACFSVPWSEAAIEGLLANDSAVAFVAEEDERVIGYVSMYDVLGEGYMNNIAVEAAARRKGVASALLEALIGYGRKHHLSFLTLEVRESNTAAIALYEKYGFVRKGMRRGFYSNPTENAIIMTREAF